MNSMGIIYTEGPIKKYNRNQNVAVPEMLLTLLQVKQSAPNKTGH